MANNSASMPNPFSSGSSSTKKHKLIAQNKMKNSPFYGPNVSASIRAQREQADRNSPNPYPRKWGAETINGRTWYHFPEGMNSEDGFKIASFATKGEADDYMRQMNANKTATNSGIGVNSAAGGKIGGWSYTDPQINGVTNGNLPYDLTPNQMKINDFWNRYNAAKRAKEAQQKIAIQYPDFSAYNGDYATALKDFNAMNPAGVWNAGEREDLVRNAMRESISDKLKRGDKVADAERQFLYSYGG